MSLGASVLSPGSITQEERVSSNPEVLTDLKCGKKGSHIKRMRTCEFSVLVTWNVSNRQLRMKEHWGSKYPTVAQGQDGLRVSNMSRNEELTEVGEMCKRQVGAAEGAAEERPQPQEGHRAGTCSPGAWDPAPSPSGFLARRAPDVYHTLPSWLTHCLDPWLIFIPIFQKYKIFLI